jgi:hypothetical protein
MSDKENDYQLFNDYDKKYTVTINTTPATITIYDGGFPPKELARILPDGDVVVSGDVTDAARAFWDAVAFYGRNVRADNLALKAENAVLRKRLKME